MKRMLTQEEVNKEVINSPYHRFLGVHVAESTDDSLTLRLPFEDTFIAGDGVDYVHGGIIATIIDIAGYFSILQVLNIPAPTLDLHINYLRPAKKEDLYAKATIVKLGRTVSVANIVVTNEEGKEIAVGRGLFSTNLG